MANLSSCLLWGPTELICGIVSEKYISACLNPYGERRQKRPIETVEGFGSGKLL